MTKSELIASLARKYSQLSQKDLETAANAVLDTVSQALAAGDRVELRGFGAFSVRKREARVARNPKNGDSVKVSERYAIYYRPGKELRERVNAGS